MRRYYLPGIKAPQRLLTVSPSSELEVGQARRRRADELLEQGPFECGVTCPASGDQLAHDADEVVLGRRFVAEAASQRRIVVEEEVAL